jgi:uncharacterized damage-inducible protein DinB
MDRTGFLAFYRGIHKPSVKLISLAPADKLHWKPGDVNMMTLGQLIKHVASCPAHLATAARNAFPPAAEFSKANEEALQQSAAPTEAGPLLEANYYLAVKIIEALSEEEFRTKQVTVPWGPPTLMYMALLAMAMHQSNHKMQLFMYLKLLGLPVNTMTLYAGI